MSILIFMLLVRQCLSVSNLSALEGRIVRGYEVEIYKYPHAVFLHFDKERPPACGSSLITDQAIITAAHCLREVKQVKGKITAFLGATIPLDSDIRRTVILVKIHPKYNPEKGKFNLGLGFFNKPVPLSSSVQKIPIRQQRPQVDDHVYTTGWGKDKPFKLPDYSDMRHLKASKHRIVSDRECKKRTGSRSPAYFCTMSIRGYHYHGDSGNGMMTKDRQLVGVVSYMINEITVYSDVIREQSWIEDALVDLSRKYCKLQKNKNKKNG